MWTGPLDVGCSLVGRYCPSLQFNGSLSCYSVPSDGGKGTEKGGRRSRPALPLVPRPLCRLPTLSVASVCTMGSSLPPSLPSLPCDFDRLYRTFTSTAHSRGVGGGSPAASVVSQIHLWGPVCHNKHHTPHIVSVNLVDDRVVVPARPVRSSEYPAVVSTLSRHFRLCRPGGSLGALSP